MRKKEAICICAAIPLLLLLTACGGSEAELTPTLDPPAIQTMAVETFANGLTMTALFGPTKSPVPIFTPTLMVLVSPTLPGFATLPAGGGLATPSCYRMTYVADVTVPDNTVMTPGQSFTKTWKVRNTGSCAWDAGFKFAFTSGESMSGAGYTLAQSVPANTETEISVAMVAPTKTGTLKGNWRMSTGAGAFFGEEVYVQIVVGGATGTPPTATKTSAPGVTPSVTATSTVTPTPTDTPTLTPVP
jgi:hypothetical protein